MKHFHNKVAVITGAASGFGREFARIAASRGMRLVLADIEETALNAVAELHRANGVAVLAQVTDVSKAAEVDSLAALTQSQFGGAHLVFNNAGVAAGGLIWESSERDWDWVMNVNVRGVVNGMRAFMPQLIAAQARGEEAHMVNTASVAGLVNAPMMGVYNVSKHAVVSLSESLFHDVQSQELKIGVSVLCPAFVPTGIHLSERNRPSEFKDESGPTESQIKSREAANKAVTSGKKTAADIAELSFAAIEAEQFYILSHKGILGSVELRMQDVLALRNPTNPFALRPELAPKK
jgi:NAD(P)-dependent dehydrogenase (short-subunit alcohol dehydrogenase family)